MLDNLASECLHFQEGQKYRKGQIISKYGRNVRLSETGVGLRDISNCVKLFFSC